MTIFRRPGLFGVHSLAIAVSYGDYLRALFEFSRQDTPFSSPMARRIHGKRQRSECRSEPPDRS